MAVPTVTSIALLASSTGQISTPAPFNASEGDWILIIVETAVQLVAAPYYYDPNDMLVVSGGSWDAHTISTGTGTAGATTAVALQVFKRKAVVGIDDLAAASGYQIRIDDGGDHQYAVIARIAGADPTNCFNQTSQASAAASTSVSIGGLTTTRNDCYIFSIVANATDTLSAQSSGEANSDLTSVSEIYDANTTTGNGGGITVIGGIKATAGAIGATTCTLATSSVQAKAMLAIQPPPAGGVLARPSARFYPLLMR